MKKYIGLPCVHCQQNFEDKDDIVVCPVCGAPSHRGCYKELGHCALADKHEDGFVWQPPKDPSINSEEQVICHNCGAANHKDQLFCQMCSTKLEQPVRPTVIRMPLGTESAPPKLDQADEWLIAGVSARELSTYIGHNSYYFLRQFQSLLGNSLQISWNWPAFIFSYLYLLYRKVYLLGIGILMLFLLLSAPEVLHTIEYLKMLSPEYFGVTLPYNKELMDNLLPLIKTFRMFKFMMAVLCGSFANKLILKKALQDIAFTRKTFGERVGSREYFTSLFFHGKPNKTAVALILVMYVLLYFSLVGYIVTLITPYLPL